MGPGWSPDGTIQRAIQSCSEGSILASLCGSAAEAYRTGLFSCVFSCLAYFRLLGFQKLFYMKKYQKQLFGRFWDQLQPIGQVFLSSGFVFAIFSSFWISKVVLYGKSTHNSLFCYVFFMFLTFFKEFSRPYPGELLQGPGGQVRTPPPPLPPHMTEVRTLETKTLS